MADDPEPPSDADPGTGPDPAQATSHVVALRLLWEGKDRPRRGPRPKLDVDDIVRAAVTVADRDGLEAMSMRRVAQELDVGTMSLYRYVPDKGALLDLMFDATCAEGTPLDDIPGNWRDKLEFSARETWALYKRHPWMLQVSSTRPTLGPNVMTGYESQLAALTGIGLTPGEMVAVTNLVDSYVSGVAQAAVVASTTERESGISDEQWWDTVWPVLESVVDWERFPVNAQVGEAGAYDESGAQPFSQFSFEFGLQRILDGIEALVRSRSEGQ